jgi:hypothetical protein
MDTIESLNHKRMFLEEVNRMRYLMLTEEEKNQQQQQSQQQPQQGTQNGGYDQHKLSYSEVKNILMSHMNDKQMAQMLAPVCYAQIQVESGGNPNIKSADGYGSVGILQVLPSTAKGLGFDPNDRYDTVKNILMYATFFNKYPARSQEDAARKWNGGPGYKGHATDKYWAKVKSVMARQGNETAEGGEQQTQGQQPQTQSQSQFQNQQQSTEKTQQSDPFSALFGK